VTAALFAGAVAAVLAWVVTGRVRAVALRRGVVATPNERSSHTLPTPTGGGAGIAAAAVVALLGTSPSPARRWVSPAGAACATTSAPCRRWSRWCS